MASAGPHGPREALVRKPRVSHRCEYANVVCRCERRPTADTDRRSRGGAVFSRPVNGRNSADAVTFSLPHGGFLSLLVLVVVTNAAVMARQGAWQFGC